MGDARRRQLAAALREHIPHVRGVIVKQDMEAAANALDQDADHLQRVRQIVQDANHQQRQLATTLAELTKELHD